jgi:Tfp pilus assembly protein PilE
LAFHWPTFSKPAPTDIAELRDRAIVAETKAVLLENALEAERRRRTRERRKDHTDTARAIAAQAQAYSQRFASLTPSQRTAAIEAGKGRR